VVENQSRCADGGAGGGFARLLETVDDAGLWPAQRRAILNIERSLK
jgi:hypothetical protein